MRRSKHTPHFPNLTIRPPLPSVLTRQGRVSVTIPPSLPAPFPILLADPAVASPLQEHSKAPNGPTSLSRSMDSSKHLTYRAVEVATTHNKAAAVAAAALIGGEA